MTERLLLNAAITKPIQDPKCACQAEVDGLHERISQRTMRDPFDRFSDIEIGSPMPNRRLINTDGTSCGATDNEGFGEIGRCVRDLNCDSRVADWLRRYRTP
jgi:hypothetical protein